MNKLFSALVAEAIGVFALCFVGILAIHAGGGLVGVALAHGLILGVMISVFGATSGGHLNPAVTIGLLVGGKIKPGPAVAYIVAQVLGGMVAGLAVMAILGGNAVDPAVSQPYTAANVVVDGTPRYHSAAASIEPMAAVIAEFIATFFLVLAVWGTAVDPRAPKIGGFGIGLTVAADILAIGPLTGAAMNPARVMGPALAAAGKYDWSQHWVYWVGPVAGGIAASLVYRYLIWPKEA